MVLFQVPVINFVYIFLIEFFLYNRLNNGWYLFIVKQISSFRESKSDDRRFYIFTATKTLHLRTDSRKDRVAWIQALVSTRGLYPLRPLSDHLSLAPNNISVSAERLKKRLLEVGSSESLVKDCEQIMLAEFSELQEQLQILCQERMNLLDTIRQLEVNFISVLYLWNASDYFFVCSIWTLLRISSLLTHQLLHLKFGRITDGDSLNFDIFPTLVSSLPKLMLSWLFFF